MKKLSIALMAAAIMAICSCGVIKTASQILCQPTQAQVEAAEAGMFFALQVLEALPQADQYRVSLQTAARVFDMVRNGICVTLPQLQAAIEAVENVSARRGKMPAKPDLVPLKKALGK